MNQKRQIIKTRSQRPYFIARIVIAFIIAVAAAVSAWWMFAHHHAADMRMPALAAMGTPSHWEEANLAGRMPQIRSTWEPVCA